jgi:hypothetical protein
VHTVTKGAFQLVSHVSEHVKLPDPSIFKHGHATDFNEHWLSLRGALEMQSVFCCFPFGAEGKNKNEEVKSDEMHVFHTFILLDLISYSH